MINVRKRRKFDGYGREVSLEDIKIIILELIDGCAIDLIERENIIKLNVPFGEVFHRCSPAEWTEILEYVDNNVGSPIPFFERFKNKLNNLF